MKRTLREKINSLGLSYPKEMTIMVMLLVAFAIGGIVIITFLKELYIGIFVVAVGPISIFFYIGRYSSIEKAQEKEHTDELISLLSYFEIFISNGNNVYNSFKKLIPYTSSFMNDAITSLLAMIDSDKSVGPYITFASKFKSHIIESLLLSIYQMVDNGENVSQFSEFDILFGNIRNNFQEDLVDGKKRALDTFNSFPLIGAGFVTIALSISILSVIGDYINVI